ncbi:MAG TPA: amidohydrolase [Longimicrobiales bacterium]|nr:amidohydrolase [Longimicrobiales bacterium]
MRRTTLALAVLLASASTLSAQQRAGDLAGDIERLTAQVNPKVVEWRRDLHQNPELGNREFRTSAKVAEHLKSLGMEVRTGIAHTGVVGLLRGGRPGPTVALRADMDALPVTEMVDVPFASKVRTEYNGQEVGVMHACGHDNHMAILMGAAEVLASVRDKLPGNVLFVFQPAEEGSPQGEDGGAGLMIQEGVFADPRPDAIFGLHVWPNPVGTVAYRPGGAMANSDGLYIKITGAQTHGAVPWGGVDPVVVASQVVLGLQTIVSRQTDITRAPAVVTIATIHGGVRSNIIPDSVVMVGTVRTFDETVQDDVHARIKRTAEQIAAASGAQAVVRINKGNPVTYNDPDLTRWGIPTLQRAAGAGAVYEGPPITGAEDFSLYQKEIPGMFFFLGITPEGSQPIPNHSPLFIADERALPVGVRTLAGLAADYLLEHARGVSQDR